MRSQIQRPNYFITNSVKKLVLALTLVLSTVYSVLAVTGGDVWTYLTDHGYRVYSVQQIKESSDWVSTNEDGSHTRVFVDKDTDTIVGHQDIEW